jgi:LEA14-like dessication related protein
MRNFMAYVKNMGKNIWIIPAVLIGWIVYKKYQLTNAVSVFFKSIDFSTMTLLNPTLNLIVQINNPTDVTAVVQNIQGILIIDGVNVGNVIGITPTILNSGSSLLAIPVTLNYSGVLDLLRKFKFGGFNLTFQGTIKVDYITLPLEFSYSL